SDAHFDVVEPARFVLMIERVAFKKSLAQLKRAIQSLLFIRFVDFRGRKNLLRAIDQSQCFLLFRVQHYFAHCFFHAIRKFAYGGAWWRAVRIEIDPWNIDSFGEVQECGAAKAGLVRIVQTGWNDLYLESAGRSRRQCDARGAGLQRLE